MIYDLQKASMGKRISAFLFDGILLVMVIVAVAFILSAVLGYDGYSQDLSDAYAKYETEYGDIELYNTWTQEKFEQYQAAINSDPNIVYIYSKVVCLAMVIVTFSVLLGFFLMEFVIPMLFGNGQTLGKKIFGIALIRKDGVQVNGMQMFTRTILGKFTIETMIPVYIVILILFNNMGLMGTIILGTIALLQIILLCATRTNSALHDILACTVAVDIASQMIFKSTDDLIAYQKKVAAEKAAKQDY